MPKLPAISIIVPVFNVAPYVSACIQSLLDQSWTDFEAIVVDDGSTDESASIIRATIGSDCRFRFATQDNQGLSAARNQGRDLAQAAVVGFLDADDRYAPDFLQVMKHAMDKHHCDWVACGIHYCFPDGSGHSHSAIHGEPSLTKHLTPRRYHFHSCHDVIRHFPSAWNKLYRRSFIGDLRFDHDTWFEDHSFFHQLAARTDNIFHIPEPLYLQTRDRPGQITRQDDDRVFDQFQVLESVKRTMHRSPPGDASSAFEKLASRLMFERSTALKNSNRRLGFAKACKRFMRDQSLEYTPDWDSDIGTLWGLEIDEKLPLSIILPWDGQDKTALRKTLTSLRNLRGPWFEAQIICRTDRAMRRAADMIGNTTGFTVTKPSTKSLDEGRLFGLQAARGRYVVFINPGDHCSAFTLINGCEAMFRRSADMGVMAVQTVGLRGDEISHHPGVHSRSSPTEGIMTQDGATALSIGSDLSAKFFRRAFLEEISTEDILERSGHQSLILKAALNGRTVYLPHCKITLSKSVIAPLTCAQKESLLPFHDQMKLPKGWQRRLLARRLERRIAQIETEGGLFKYVRLAVLALRTASARHSGLTPYPAGLDTDVGPTAELLLDRSGALRWLFRCLRQDPAINRQIQLDSEMSDQTRIWTKETKLLFPLKENGLFRCHVSFQNTSYANLSFTIDNSLAVPFHLSFRQKENCVVLNTRSENGRWNRERFMDLPLPKSGGEVAIRFGVRTLIVFIDGLEWRRFKTRVIRQVLETSHVTLQGDIRPLDIQTAPAREDLFLDDRLALRIAGHVLGGRIKAHDSFVTPLISADAPDGLRSMMAHLPGRLWSDQKPVQSLELRAVDQNDQPIGAPLVITKTEMLSRLETLLTQPLAASDSGLVLQIINHAQHGQLTEHLSQNARERLAGYIAYYGLSDAIDTSGQLAKSHPLLKPQSAWSRHPAADLALARLAQNQRSSRPLDPIDLIKSLPLPQEATQDFYLALADVLCADPGQFHVLFRHAKSTNVWPFDIPADVWGKSAILPYLVSDHRLNDAQKILNSLQDPQDLNWLSTPALAWMLRWSFATTQPDETSREALVIPVLDLVERMSKADWSRIHCSALTRVFADITARGLSYSGNQGAEILNFTLRHYGLSSQYWEHVENAKRVSHQLRRAYRNFDRIHRAATSERNPEPAELNAAICYFETLGNQDARRYRYELIGPNSNHQPQTNEEALRWMAHPLSGVASKETSEKATSQICPPDLGLHSAFSGVKTKSHPNTLVLVFSCQKHLKTHIPALRNGWLMLLPALQVPYLIVVGNGNGDVSGDILSLDAPDDYEGLPDKTLAAVKWVHDNTGHSHLFKIDDDCFLNAPLFFNARIFQKHDYYGRALSRKVGSTNRAWHQDQSGSKRARLELDQSCEPSVYADGGSGYTLSRRAMAALLAAAESPDGQRLRQVSFMEDKLVGDLLALKGIRVASEGYTTSIRRAMRPDGHPVSCWQNNFLPSKIAPVMQAHLDRPEDQKPALKQLSSNTLYPKKIWPSVQSPKLGYQSNALELISCKATAELARTAEVVVVSCLRNELFMLPHFLSHYRQLGVQAFLIADNGSTDGTLEYLRAQPDVVLFSVDTDYQKSNYGVAWQQALIAGFRVGKWTLVADADELLFWEDNQTQTLPDLLKTRSFETAEASRVFMVDMYPKAAIETVDFRKRSPFQAAGYCEAQPFLTRWPGQGPFSNAPTWTSALRHRLLPGSRPDLFVAQKIALLKYQPWMRFSAGLHFVADVKLSDRELLFGHFKYSADFHRKAIEEAARRQHFNQAEEYRAYLSLAAKGANPFYHPDLSVPWQDCAFVKARLDASPADPVRKTA